MNQRSSHTRLLSVLMMLAAACAFTQAAAAQGRGAAPAAPAAPAPPNAPVPGPTFAEAQKALSSSWAAADKMSVKVSCAIVDSRGDLIALGRMDGARFLTTDVARGKALTSAIYGQPSAALTARGTNPATQAFNEATVGRLRFIQGAVPIIRGGFVVGAVGASGASAQQDEQIATAGRGGLQ